jgi:peptidyl-prolyl cis-trans isomerase D
MRYTIILFPFLLGLFLTPNAVYSQSDELEVASMLKCWKCIAATKTKSSSEIITECEIVAKEYDSKVGGEIAQLIIARQHLEKGIYPEAANLLIDVHFKNEILNSIAFGLQGDCQSELRNYKKAQTFYEKAALIKDNDFYTPHYLFKAYQCAMALDDTQSGQVYLHTIKANYSEFSKINDLDKFTIPDQSNIKTLDINRTFNTAKDYNNLGIGTIYGEKVKDEGFRERLYNEQKEAQRQKDSQLQQQGRPPGSELADPVDPTEVWHRYVEEMVFRKQYTSIHLSVGMNEFDAYLYGTDGFNVLPDIGQAFSDSQTGQFNPRLLMARIDEMQTNSDPAIVDQWEQSKQYYTKQRLKDKFIDIIKTGVYATRLEALNEYHYKNDEFKIQYKFFPYSDIPNKDISFKDRDLHNYYDENKAKYKNEFSTRQIKVVNFPLVPSKTDSSNLELELNKLKSLFESAESDSSFVMLHSERPVYDPRFGYKKQGTKTMHPNFTYPEHMEKTFKGAKTGDVVGPFYDDGMMKIAKIIDVHDVAMTVRHILISAPRQDNHAVAVARKTTDSLMTLINQDNFEYYVETYSEDPGSKHSGGAYEDFEEGDMVPEFNDYSLIEPIGKIGYVQTDFGFHIMEVLERKEDFSPCLAIVEKKIYPSQETVADLSKNASSLIQKINTAIGDDTPQNEIENLFEEIITKEGLSSMPIYLDDNNPRLSMIQADKAKAQILGLAYAKQAKPGTLCKTPIIDDDRILIALYANKFTKGESKYNNFRDAVIEDYVRELKANYIIKSQKLAGEDINETIHLSDFRIGNKHEPEVIGMISRSQSGNEFKNYRGEIGVYSISILKSSVSAGKVDLFKPQNLLLDRQMNAIVHQLRRALLIQANAINNLTLSKYGIRP